MLSEEDHKMTTAYEYLKDWILNFLSQPNVVFNGFSACPYAKKALIDNKVTFIESKDYAHDIPALLDNWDNAVDVVIFVCPHNVDPKEFEEQTRAINEAYLSKGFVCLEDHKDSPEEVAGLFLNNGQYNIILCQRLEKLNQAAELLKSKGYYNNWTNEYYNDVVTWREESFSHNSE
jgi:hypothetical protein